MFRKLSLCLVLGLMSAGSCGAARAADLVKVKVAITGATSDVVFWGDKGTLSINNGGYVLRDHAGKEIDKATGDAGDKGHLTNFLEAVRGNAKPNSEIAAHVPNIG